MDLLLSPDCLTPALRDAVTYRTIAAGQTLFQAGDAASNLFVVEMGRIQLFRCAGEDKLVTLELARAQESFAEAALFMETYACTAIAEVDSRLIVYPKSTLLAVLADLPKLAEALMEQMARKIQSLEISLELRDIRVAHRRVLQYLRYQAQSQNQTVVSFDRPLKDTAGELGMTPETLSRALTRLEHEGVITRKQRLITLTDPSVFNEPTLTDSSVA